MCWPSAPWRACLVVMAEPVEMTEPDVTARLARLRSLMADPGCEALLVTHLVNVRYLTGFTGSAAVLLVLPEGSGLTPEGRYGDKAAEQLAPPGVAAAAEGGPRLAAQQDVLGEAAGGS